ncbi:MAG: GNAT family N-acetyltransferase [Solirubrobacteraceae bacterium MAG38_C4-C5]|nr:GNAT family N-acetyltransferase [Candidatus Siliceabacter maunaloa]
MIEVRPAVEAQEVRCAIALRHEVFVDEQGVDAAQEHDGRDDEATHLVALREGALVGTCRLLGDGDVIKLGRLAVAAPHRRRGVATRLLAEGERWAREHGSARIVLHAQSYARALYAAAGYGAVGEPFTEAGIEHVRMERSLA